MLFLSARAAGKPKVWQIWTGQYLGVSALVAISALAAVGLTLIPDRWVGLVGLVPFSLGAWLGSHRRVIAEVHRLGHWIAPGVFMVIGTLILLRSGS